MGRRPTRAAQIGDVLAEKILGGEIAPGGWLPSERELAQTYGADRSTVRRAMRMLAQRYLVVVHPGIGVQVAPSEVLQRDASDVTCQVGDWRGFHVSATLRSRVPYTHTTVRQIDADASLAGWLAVPTRTPVLERARLQGLVGEPPVQTSTTYVPPAIVLQLPVLREINTGPGGIYSRLEDVGYRIRFEEHVACRAPSRAERATLEIKSSQPVLILWRRCYDQHGKILEVTNRVVVGDRHELVYRYDAPS